MHIHSDTTAHYANALCFFQTPCLDLLFPKTSPERCEVCQEMAHDILFSYKTYCNAPS